MLFPNGRLPGRRWRWLAWLSVFLIAAGALWQALSPGAFVSLGFMLSPFGIEGLPRADEPVQTMVFAFINRTLVYGTVTTTLVALYFGIIVVLQRLFVSLTGQRPPSRSWPPPS